MIKIGHVFDLRDPRFRDLRSWTFESFPEVEFHEIDLSKPSETASNADVTARAEATGPPDSPPDPAREIPIDSPTKFDVIFWSDTSVPLAKLRSIPEFALTPVLAFLSNSREANPKKSDLQSATDILLLPTEKLLFLQKLEFLLSKDEAVSPSFLFELKLEREDPNLRFDLGKSVQITHLSETSCTLISPFPLARGLEGTLACNVFWNEGDALTWKDRLVETRVQDSVPYLDSSIASGTSTDFKFEVRLRFLGLRQSQLRNLRLWLTKNLKAKWPEIERSNSKPVQRLRVALLSPRISAEHSLRENLKDLAEIEVTRYQGLQSFLSRLATESSKSRTPPSVANSSLPESGILYHHDFIGPKRPNEVAPPLHAKSVSLKIRSDDLFVEKIEPPPQPSSLLLGYPIAIWEKDASPLLKAMEAIDRSSFQESLDWVAKGQLSERLDRHSNIQVILHPKPWIKEKFDLHMRLISPREGTKSPVVEIAIHPVMPHQTDHNAKLPILEETGFEAVLIDASLFDSLEGQRELLRERLLELSNTIQKAELKNAFGNAPPLVLFHADNNFDDTSLRGTPVRQVVFNFEDRRYIAELFISLSRPELWTSPGLAIAEFAAELDAAIFRPTRLIAISESGFRIMDRIPFKISTNLRVLSSLWPNRELPIWARVRRVQGLEDAYAEDFIFLAVDDEIQRAIRNFELQDHVNRKKAQSG